MSETRIVVDPLTRIEGHMRMQAVLGADGKIADAWSTGTMWRGIEVILKGRDPRDAWAFTERICGVCTGIHALAAVRAVEGAIGIKIPANANIIRNLMNAVLFVQDHVTHFYQLHALDWVDVISALNADPREAAAIEAKISPTHELNGAGYFAAIPAGAQVLVQLDGSKELLEGFLPADGEHFDDFLDDSIQAISYQGAGADNAQLDVVLFANTLTNKTNQRDEYNFISNAAWAAVLNDTGYSDVAPNAWYAEAVAAVTGQGLMNGVTSKAFGPDVTTTRGMLVTVLHRMAGEPAASASAGFADVAAGSYCAAAVDWAYEAGITSGASSTGFAPDSALTREQAVTLLCNYAEAQGLDVSAAAYLSGYPDASAVSAFAQDAVAWAVDAGLLTGTGAGTLNPQGTATRAELAALLVRAEALFTAE